MSGRRRFRSSEEREALADEAIDRWLAAEQERVARRERTANSLYEAIWAYTEGYRPRLPERSEP